MTTKTLTKRINRFLTLVLTMAALATGQTAWAQSPTTWSELQTLLTDASTDAANPTLITLYTDIVAESTDTYLNIPAGHHVIIDLNGHKIDRNLTEPDYNGQVFYLKGYSNNTLPSSLTIRDSQGGGIITGGNVTGWNGGGAFFVTYSSTLTIEGGTITGNKSHQYGGGAITATNRSTVRMTGGSITGNVGNTINDESYYAAGAICLKEQSHFYLSGGSITGNLCGGHTGDTYGKDDCGGIGFDSQHEYVNRVHLSGSYTLSGNLLGNYENGTLTNSIASDYLHTQNNVIVIEDAISPTAPAVITVSDNSKTQVLTSGWSNYMTTDPTTCFTLGSFYNTDGKVIGLRDGNLVIDTPLAALWHADDDHDGTSEEKAYIISTPKGLDLLASQVNGTDGYTANEFSGKFFKLGNDITYTHKAANEAGADTENNFTAIGTSSNQFKGTFDGCSKAISGIRINKGSVDYQGLFGYVGTGGTVKNVILTNAVITGHSNTGAIVGENGGSLITNYYHGCTVNSQTTNVGTSTGDVDQNNGARAVYTLTQNDGVTATATAAVNYNATDYYTAGTKVTLDYTGNVPTGYVFAYTVNGTAITGNIFTISADTSFGISLTDVWGVSGSPAADGSAEHPYLIGTPAGLDLLASYVNGSTGSPQDFTGKHFLQTAPITYTGTENNYTPIGNNNHHFCGHYDGDGNTISGIRINSSDDYKGLFGEIGTGAEVKNVVLADAQITGAVCTGGIAGRNDGGTISGCVVEDDVTIGYATGNVTCHGGIVGNIINGGVVCGCVSKATINGKDYGSDGSELFGGIAGQNNGGTIRDCLYTGSTVKGKQYIGAIVGNNISEGTLTNNYYTNSYAPRGVSGVDQNGARRAWTVTLNEDIVLVGDETIYNYSGITAIGTGNYAQSYTAGTTTTIYSGQYQTLTLNYTGTVPDGYILVYSYYDYQNHVLDGNTFTMPYRDVTVSANLVPLYALTLDNGITTTTTPAVTKNNIDYYTAGTEITLSYTGEVPEGFAVVYIVNGTQIDGNTFTMPDGDVTVTVTYKKAPIIIECIDADGIRIVNVSAIPLDNTMTTLEAGTYFVNSDVTFTGTVTMTGNVHLVLGDGCMMNIGSSENRINGMGISNSGANLYIYYQSARTGALNIYTTGNDNYGIQANAITTEGGNITVDTNGAGAHALYATNGDIYIKNGTITATATGTGANAITVDNGNFQYRGCTVTTSATNGYAICVKASNGRYNFIRRNENDCIIIGSTGLYYDNTTIVNFDGMFTDGTNIYSRTQLTGSDLGPLAGKTLRSVCGISLDSNGVFMDGDANNLTAEFSNNNYTSVSIPSNLTVKSVNLNRTFTVDKPATIMLPFSKSVSDISGATFYTFGGVTYNSTTDKWEATMNEVTGSIAANTPYLVMPSTTSITFNGGATLNTTGGGGQQTAQSGSNWTFKGTYEYREWYSNGAYADEIGKVYGFAGVERTDLNVEVGDFVKVASGARIRPKGCYLLWNDTPNAAPAMNRASSATDELPQRITVRLVGANGEVTEVNEVIGVNGVIDDSWYTLDGRKLDKQPTTKGLYLHEGRKVVIK